MKQIPLKCPPVFHSCVTSVGACSFAPSPVHGRSANVRAMGFVSRAGLYAAAVAKWRARMTLERSKSVYDRRPMCTSVAPPYRCVLLGNRTRTQIAASSPSTFALAHDAGFSGPKEMRRKPISIDYTLAINLCLYPQSLNAYRIVRARKTRRFSSKHTGQELEACVVYRNWMKINMMILESLKVRIDAMISVV